jgi:hypothetical protein
MPFEGKVGPKIFLAIYLITGVFASLFHSLFALTAGSYFGLDPRIIGVGASGAIFGVLGAFVSTYPNERILFPLLIVRKWPVWVIAGIYFFVETIITVSGPDDHIGHFAHIGGFVGGLLFAPILNKLQLSEEKADITAKLDLDKLEELATSYKQKDMLERIRGEDELEVQQAWLEEFLKSIDCPECGKKLTVNPGRAKCECGFKIKY